MKIIILRSSFQTDDFVKNEYADLIQRLENECNAEIKIIGDEFVETHGRVSLLQITNYHNYPTNPSPFQGTSTPLH